MAYDAPGGTGANFTENTWSETIQSAVYEKSRFLQNTIDYGKGLAQKTVRKMGAAAGATVLSTSDGTDMTFLTMNPTTAVMTPAWMFVGHQYPDSLPWTMGPNIDRAAAENAENALTAYIENQFLGDVPSLTSYVGSGVYNVDAPGFRGAVASLSNAAKGEAEPGVSSIYALLGALQHDDAMSIPEFTHADQRGDGQNPNVTGMIGKGNGVRLMFSTLLSSDGNGLHGVLWVPSAFGHFFNSRVKGEKQRYKKTTYVMADCHFAHNIIHNARAVGIRTATT